MSNESFEYALVNNEVDQYFKGSGNYLCLNRDYGVHNYGPALFLVLRDVQCGKIDTELFVHEFTSFVKRLRNNPEDQEHFFGNIEAYVRRIYLSKSINIDVLFDSEVSCSAIRHYLNDNKDSDVAKRVMSYIQRDFPQAKILTYLE
ncbi:hypothetical protein [Vibrio hepatarius]|uniref:hypothetical protein n=1 Tax=Vibrio hepatarius TaxID=171383 RepID=UPI001C0903E8|nr:hypothetical protein [Vibrio hepatarius]MBU2897645.1 hypothetical protein [Vibrio hepatarius]